ncbi:MAG: hypothetical protein KAS72_10505 [Phycisphaerales bacterium]|nr:hypothetical protein [Phycisphaerales bacterium]
MRSNRTAWRGAIIALATTVWTAGAAGEIIVQRFAADSGLLPDPITYPEVEIVNGVVKIHRPYTPAMLPDYYIYTTLPNEDIAGIELAIDAGWENRDVSIFLANPYNPTAFAARHVGHILLGNQGDPECPVRKSRVKASRISGNCGALSVRADTVWSHPGDRFGTVEMYVGGDITADWTLWEPAWSREQGGIWIEGDLDAHVRVIGVAPEDDPNNPSITGDEFHVSGDITENGGLLAACNLVGMDLQPLTIAGNVVGQIHTDGWIVTFVTVHGDLAGSITAGGGVSRSGAVIINGAVTETGLVEAMNVADPLTNPGGRIEVQGPMCGVVHIRNRVGGSLQFGHVRGSVVIDDRLNDTGTISFVSMAPEPDKNGPGTIVLNALCPGGDPWLGTIQQGEQVLTPGFYTHAAQLAGGSIQPLSFRYDCQGDLDGDNRVDQNDLGILLSDYGRGCRGDLDGDGDTDASDLGILLARYLLPCE